MDRNKERTSNLTKLILVIGVLGLLSPCLLLVNAFSTRDLQPLSKAQLDLMKKSSLAYKELESIKGGSWFCSGFQSDCESVSCASRMGPTFTCSRATVLQDCFECTGGNTPHCVSSFSHFACLDTPCVSGSAIPNGCGDKRTGKCYELSPLVWGCLTTQTSGSCGAGEGPSRIECFYSYQVIPYEIHGGNVS